MKPKSAVANKSVTPKANKVSPEVLRQMELQTAMNEIQAFINKKCDEVQADYVFQINGITPALQERRT